MKPEHKVAFDKFTASHNGKPLDQKELLKPSQMITKFLAARYASMTPEQQKAVGNLLTPETEGVLKILLPEVAGIIDRGMKFLNRRARNG